MNDDAQLLRRYAAHGSEDAFAELVRRQVDLVYSAALRLVNGDVHRAQDVTQQVFTELARRADRLCRHPALAGWLYTTTRQMARRVIRSEQRRKTREQEATIMNELLRETDPEADWARLRPVLDDAMHELGDSDRLALLLRFFQNKNLKDIGAALNLNENAARMRIERALDKLRVRLARKGVTSTSVALGLALAACAVTAAPAAFVSTLAGASLAGASTGTGATLSLLKFMTATKLKAGISGGVILAALLFLYLVQRGLNPSASLNSSTGQPAVEHALDPVLVGGASTKQISNRSRRGPDAAPLASPVEIVNSKLIQFGRSRRELANALARRYGVAVPDEVKLFFDAVETGNWDLIEARFKVINGGDSSAGHGANRPPGVNELWCAIIDAYGAAEQVHLWPAGKLLDYGNGIINSLRPGMIYVGGSDDGRWVPELINDTSDDERHVVITQNGLADGRYLDYINEMYGDRMATLSQEDNRRIYAEYSADAQKRLEHDQQFPDEPKQVQPGENIKMVDGHVQVSGVVGVMAINEKILQALLAKNPDLSFAIQQSYPLKGTFADALPLGPIMELRAQNDQNTFSSERAAESVDYWRTTTQNVLADPQTANSENALRAYSHDANSAANLLAAHNFNAQAEQAYQLASQLWPGSPEPVYGLAEIYARTGRAQEARQMLDDFARKYPDQRAAVEASSAAATVTWKAGQ